MAKTNIVPVLKRRMRDRYSAPPETRNSACLHCLLKKICVHGKRFKRGMKNNGARADFAPSIDMQANC